jgi:hypothetical protein
LEFAREVDVAELLISFAELSEKLILKSHQNQTHFLEFSEAAHRLEQLDVLLSDVATATEQYRNSPTAAGAVRVKSYAEAFYYFAHRAMAMLEKVYGKDSVKRVSGGSIIGVVTVRNWLIEHADNAEYGVMAITWEFDTPKLVVLKPFGGGPDRETFDRGLWPNAQQLRGTRARACSRGTRIRPRSGNSTRSTRLDPWSQNGHKP